MTNIAQKQTKRMSKKGRKAFALVSALLLTLFFWDAETVIFSMTEGLRLCALRVIPSLFPFMVVSELIVKSGIASFLGRWLSIPFRTLFHMRADGAAAWLLGTLCGFPVGAKSALSLYESGRLCREELSHLLCFCNNPSSAFVINAVGITLFGCRAFGTALYATTLLSSLLVGILFRLARRKAPVESRPVSRVSTQENQDLGLFSFAQAVADSARSMLTVCAFVLFFHTLSECLGTLLRACSLPKIVSTLLFGFLELTGGVSQIASSLSPHLAVLCCALMMGWSGLSVHLQIIALCRVKISFIPYFAAKILQSLLNVSLMEAYLRIARPNWEFTFGALPTYGEEAFPHAVPLLGFFFFSLGIHILLSQKRFRALRCHTTKPQKNREKSEK